jgi:hypothetical protein
MDWADAATLRIARNVMRNGKRLKVVELLRSNCANPRMADKSRAPDTNLTTRAKQPVTNLITRAKQPDTNLITRAKQMVAVRDLGEKVNGIGKVAGPGIGTSGSKQCCWRISKLVIRSIVRFCFGLSSVCAYGSELCPKCLDSGRRTEVESDPFVSVQEITSASSTPKTASMFSRVNELLRASLGKRML